MDATSLSLILAVLFGGWVVTVALATGAFKVGRYHPHPHDNEGKRQH
ncbi:MAG: hypothetical protein WCF26_23970 [Candidatus Sulfotelmatobacter sp.]